VVHKTIDYPGVPVDHSTIKENHGILKNVRIPIRPHFGVMGVAPRRRLRRLDSAGLFRRQHWTIGGSAKGATMFYPIAGPGRLVLDRRFARSQGDSDSAGTAIECFVDRHVQLIFTEGLAGGNVAGGTELPAARTRTSGLLHGFSFPTTSRSSADRTAAIYEKSSVDLALKDAFRKMRAFLMTPRELTEDEAISLMSIAVDFGVTQVVDGPGACTPSSRRACSPAPRPEQGPDARSGGWPSGRSAKLTRIGWAGLSRRRTSLRVSALVLAKELQPCVRFPWGTQHEKERDRGCTTHIGPSGGSAFPVERILKAARRADLPVK